MTGARSAVFLDRDGVINENRSDYVKRWDEVVFLAGAFEALRRMAEAGAPVVVVTNQSAVGRGIITREEAEALNRRIVAEIRMQSGRIDATYLCPHHPEERCACRKPAPGMLLAAARDHCLDLSSSFVVGDALSDMGAARAVGAHGVLVRTGRGETEFARIPADSTPDFVVVPNLGAAVDRIVAEFRKGTK